MRANPRQRPQKSRRTSWRRRDPRPVPPTLSAMLTALPSLPRPVLSRMAAAIIDRLVVIDGDPDLEDGDEDRCSAHDDDLEYRYTEPRAYPGDPSDAEDDDPGGCEHDGREPELYEGGHSDYRTIDRSGAERNW